MLLLLWLWFEAGVCGARVYGTLSLQYSSPNRLTLGSRLRLQPPLRQRDATRVVYKVLEPLRNIFIFSYQARVLACIMFRLCVGGDLQTLRLGLAVRVVGVKGNVLFGFCRCGIRLVFFGESGATFFLLADLGRGWDMRA